MIVVFAHAGHWISGLLYLVPLLALMVAVKASIAWVALVQRRTRTTVAPLKPRVYMDELSPFDKNEGGGVKAPPPRFTDANQPYDFGAAFGVQRRRLSVLV